MSYQKCVISVAPDVKISRIYKTSEKNKALAYYRSIFSVIGEEISNIDEISDKNIDYCLQLGKIPKNDPFLEDADIESLERVIYQIKLLQQGETPEPICLLNDYLTNTVDIYDGYHRIRAHQYLGYDKILCLNINDEAYDGPRDFY